MNTENGTEKQPVGVIFVKEAGCQAWLKPAVDRVRAMLYEISAEAGIPILVKNITAQEAINGALPAHLVTQGWELFYRMNTKMYPVIIIMGKFVAAGQQPDRAVIKEALLNASPIKTINNEEKK